MSPFSKFRASNNGAITAHIPAEDLQLRLQVSRESETTSAPSMDTRACSTPLSLPPPSHQSPRQLRDDSLTDFFGGRGQRLRSQQQQQQEHQNRSPPPYSPDWDGEKLPQYSLCPDLEADTVARQMFKYGFFFPFFWAVGVYFLLAPMRVSDDWQPDKSAEEKEKMLTEMRQTETKWAKRCLWALLSFFACIIILIVAVVVSRHH